jgi:hypothetical protein
MKGALLLVVRIVLSLILVGSLVTFVVLYSVSQNVNEGNYRDILTDVAFDVFEGELSDSEGLKDFDLNEDVRDNLGEEIEREINEELARQGIASIEVYFEGIRSALIVLGIISLVLIVSIFFLSVPRYKAAMNLGVVGLISGLPFFFVKSLNLAGEYSSIDGLGNVAESISDSLFIKPS